jgi:hypothetical protein
MIIKSEGGEGELVEEHAIMVSGCFLHCCVFMRYVGSWISFEGIKISDSSIVFFRDSSKRELSTLASLTPTVELTRPSNQDQ